MFVCFNDLPKHMHTRKSCYTARQKNMEILAPKQKFFWWTFQLFSWCIHCLICILQLSPTFCLLMLCIIRLTALNLKTNNYFHCWYNTIIAISHKSRHFQMFRCFVWAIQSKTKMGLQWFKTQKVSKSLTLRNWNESIYNISD